MKEYSINKRAEKLLGKRSPGIIILEPWELQKVKHIHYKCPICKIDCEAGENESFTWSEYNGFLYCYKCNKDIPSFMCIVNKGPGSIDQAIDIFLDTVEDAIKKIKRK